MHGDGDGGGHAGGDSEGAGGADRDVGDAQVEGVVEPDPGSGIEFQDGWCRGVDGRNGRCDGHRNRGRG